jgi:hypothetical protein
VGTVAEMKNFCFEVSFHLLNLRPFGIMCGCVLLTHEKITKYVWGNGVRDGNVEIILHVKFIKCLSVLFYARGRNHRTTDCHRCSRCN